MTDGPLRLRPARADDLPAMELAKRQAGLAAWGHILSRVALEGLGMPDRWRGAVERPMARCRVLVAELAGQVVGFALTRPSGDSDASPATGELDGFYVAPAAWGRGVGRALLSAAVQQLREDGFEAATLWTATENHRPRRIYQVAGWQLDGAERHRELDGQSFSEVRYRMAL